MATFPPGVHRAPMSAWSFARYEVVGKHRGGTHAHPYNEWHEAAVATDVAPRHRADVEREDGAA